MQKTYFIAYLIAILALFSSCNRTDNGRFHADAKQIASQEKDTVYTRQAAMSIYAYQPVRALQILDSAVIVGNLREWEAEVSRARVYSMTQSKEEINAMVGSTTDICLDSARAIGERLLNNDSLKADLESMKELLEDLTYAARLQNDTTRWMLRSRQLVDVCRQIGADATTAALRTEAEIGAALCMMGKEAAGMAKIDSVIMCLSPKIGYDRNPSEVDSDACQEPRSTEFGVFRFNELDALIIALKRKIVILGLNDKYTETVPLARKIIERLEDYEKHPDVYHDGSDREPENDQERFDYIRFYRSQAQNFITAAYASLGESDNMIEAYAKIENSVREATTREQLARYNALQQQMEAERQRLNTDKANLRSFAIGVIALLFFVFAGIVFLKNRTISRKNRYLAEQIAEGINYKEKYWEEKRAQTPVETPGDINALSDEQLFQYVDELIVRERLFLDARFGRQTIMDRFQLPKDRIGSLFSKGSEYGKLTNYIQHLRLEYATKLLIEEPQKSIEDIAVDCGFSSHKYFTDRFRQLFSMTPSEFRRARL